MKQRSLPSILMVVGTAILALLLLSPFLLALFFLVVEQQFLFDYLLTAELGLVACVGALALTIATMHWNTKSILLFIFLPLMLLSLFILMLMRNPHPVMGALVLVLYNGSLIGLLVHGIRSLRA
ncbi:MAG: hypothetical protein AB7D92_06605 [Sphaerochaeta sp.]